MRRGVTSTGLQRCAFSILFGLGWVLMRRGRRWLRGLRGVSTFLPEMGRDADAST
jgi:hypothetical protein